MRFDDLKILCALHGVSGREDEVRDYIAGRIGGVADDMSVDAMGNLHAFKRGASVPGKKIVLCSHMDEVGVIVTGYTEEGCLRFAMAGSVDSRVVVGKQVTIGKGRVFGTIGCKAVHMVKKEERDKAIEVDDMYIDIGAKDSEDAKKLVAPGDTGAFDEEVREFGDGFIKAKAIDDRFGCAVLITLMESELPVDCHFAFTVQEEVGLRGAYAAAFRAAPDVALIIEGTTAADMPSVAENKKICKIGGGVVIPFMDGATIYNRELFTTLSGLADSNGIKWQTKNVVAGGTDAAAFQRSRAGVKTVGIAAPVRNLHSPSCVAKRSDMEAVLELARLFLEQVVGSG